MHKRILLFLIVLYNACALQAQKAGELLSERQLKKEKVYKNLDKALKNPEKVIVLDLSGQNLDSVPASIGQFTNLQVLNLGWKTKKSARILAWRAKKVGGGILHFDRFEGKYVNYNHISMLPAEIEQLSNLQQIDLSYNYLTEVPFVLANLKNLKYIRFSGCDGRQGEVERLKSMLPANCVFAYQ